jgi:hypothetical protein
LWVGLRLWLRVGLRLRVRLGLRLRLWLRLFLAKDIARLRIRMHGAVRGEILQPAVPILVVGEGIAAGRLVAKIEAILPASSRLVA